MRVRVTLEARNGSNGSLRWQKINRFPFYVIGNRSRYTSAVIYFDQRSKFKDQPSTADSWKILSCIFHFNEMILLFKKSTLCFDRPLI